MGDLVIPVLNVIAPSTPADFVLRQYGTAGEKIDAGMSLYQDPTNTLIKKASATTAIKAKAVGIAINSAEIGQGIGWVGSNDKIILEMGPILVQGEIYAVSVNDGKIVPYRELILSNFVTIIGWAKSNHELVVDVNVIGSVYSGWASFAPKITPVLDTSVYAVGDVLFNPVEIPNATSVNGGDVTLMGFQITDESDQAPAFDIYMLIGNIALGTINVAPNIADVLASFYIVGGPFKVVSGDYADLGGVQTGYITFGPHIMNTNIDSKSLWMSAVSQSAFTFAASDIKIRPMFL